jgi:hypothetical protein
MDAEVASTVPDAQSALNEVHISEAVEDDCRTHDVVADPPQGIPLTQNHPSKCLIRILWSLPSSFHPFFSFVPHISAYVAGDILDNVDVPPVATQVHSRDGFLASNSVEIMNDSDPYEIARAVDSDDDRPIGELTESDVEMLKRIFPGRRDPRVHEFNDLAHFDQAFVEGWGDELLEAPEAGPSMVIEKGRVFKDLRALKRWLQQFAVIRTRPYKVLHSYVERRYTIVCDKEHCQ